MAAKGRHRSYASACHRCDDWSRSRLTTIVSMPWWSTWIDIASRDRGPKSLTQLIRDGGFNRTRRGARGLLYAAGFKRPVNTTTPDTECGRDLRHRAPVLKKPHRLFRL